ncbi:MAG: hypothetical protein AAGD07_18140 [Planctomycetota bacterium]
MSVLVDRVKAEPAAIPVDRLLKGLRERPGSLALLHGIASELSGPGKRLMHQILAGFERGDPVADALQRDGAGRWCLGAIQASVSGMDQEATRRLAEELRLDLHRRRMRGRCLTMMVIGKLYLLVSAFVAWFVTWQTSPLVFDYDGYWWTSRAPSSVMVLGFNQDIQRAFGVLLIVILVALVSFFVRVAVRRGRRNAWFWDHVPWFGSSMMTIDLAAMSQSIRQSTRLGWTYPQALMAARLNGQSPRLNAWMSDSVLRLERGESMETVMRDLPSRGSILDGASVLLSGSPDQATIVWDEIARALHEQSSIQVGRASFALPAMFVLGSLAILGSIAGFTAWQLRTMFELLSGLT